MKIVEVIDFWRTRDDKYKHIDRYSYGAIIKVKLVPWIPFLPFTRDVEVACDAGSVYWYFAQTGEYTPGNAVESMARAERRKRDW